MTDWRLRRPWQLWPTRTELVSAYYDLAAWLGGWCNHCPHRDPRRIEGRGSAGYSFWRCEKRRGHLPPHRYRSYSWGSVGAVHYNPSEIDTWWARVSPWAHRHVTGSWFYRMRRRFAHLARWAESDCRIPDIDPTGGGPR